MTVTAASLFSEWFFPLYPEDAKRDLVQARTTDANVAQNVTLFNHLGDAAARFAANAPEAMGVSTLSLDLDFSDASIHRLSAALTRDVRERLMAQGQKGTAENALFNLVIHGAAYVGACLVKGHGGQWAVRRPLWESLVQVESHLGTGDLPVFHWWLKSLADDATATLADRYRTHVEVPRTQPEVLPRFVVSDRALPRLKRPRYDSFYKYLRAHLPELRDLGENFPSPERFEELRFEHLSFTVVGEGHMVVVHGPNAAGLHAFWLSHKGFEKSAFWPCDTFPEPLLRSVENANKLEVVLSQNSKVTSFEILWWGP